MMLAETTRRFWLLSVGVTKLTANISIKFSYGKAYDRLTPVEPSGLVDT